MKKANTSNTVGGLKGSAARTAVIGLAVAAGFGNALGQQDGAIRFTMPVLPTIDGCNAPGGLQSITSADEPDQARFWCGTPPTCLTVQPGAYNGASYRCAIIQFARREPRYDPHGRRAVNGVRDPQDLLCDAGLLAGSNPAGGVCPPLPVAPEPPPPGPTTTTASTDTPTPGPDPTPAPTLAPTPAPTVPPESCPIGFYDAGGACCQNGTVLVGGQCTIPTATCPPNQWYDAELDECLDYQQQPLQCATGEYVTDLSQCPTPPPSTSTPTVDFCTSMGELAIYYGACMFESQLGSTDDGSGDSE